MKRAEAYEVNLEGGLDISLNVEVNPRDPAGITVPYRLLVPKLFYEYSGEDSAAKEINRFKRLISFRRKKDGDSYLAAGEAEDDMSPPPASAA